MNEPLPNTLSEAKIIEGCIKGNGNAQRELYERLAPRMLPVCIRYMGDIESARDVLQDGFVTLFGKIGSYKGQGSFEGWARKIFVNTALMALRKKDALKDAEEINPSTTSGLLDCSAFEKLSAKELLQVISQMPEGYRAVFNLAVFEELPHSEIARMLGISEGASRSQLSRGRSWLQQKLNSLGYGF